jgi:hypothetical protein
LKRRALRIGAHNAGLDRAVDRGLGKFDRQRRRRRRQRMTDRSRRHAYRTKIVVMAISGMVRAFIAVGGRSRGDKPQKAVLGAGSINGVEMTEQQRQLDHQRKKRDPGSAFDIRPNPPHAATRPTSKGLRIKPLSSCRKFAKLAERCQPRYSHVSPDFGRLWDFGNASRYWRRQRRTNCATSQTAHQRLASIEAKADAQMSAVALRASGIDTCRSFAPYSVEKFKVPESRKRN